MAVTPQASNVPLSLSTLTTNDRDIMTEENASYSPEVASSDVYPPFCCTEQKEIEKK